MLFVISQIIVLMTSTSSGLGTPPDQLQVNAPESVLNDIKTTNEDFKEVAESIDEINAEPEGVVTEAEADEIELVNSVQGSAIPTVSAPTIEQSVNSKTGNQETEKIAAKKKNIVKNVEPVQPIKKLTVIDISPVTTDYEFSSIDETAMVSEAKSGYIKHDHKGATLVDESEKWTCVQDTTTGLMWEVKDQGDAMRHSNNLYSWYNPKNTIEPGKSDGGRCKGGSDCDTYAYVKAMNQRNYCGYNDWQLPTREQMQTLVVLNNEDKQSKINKQYFPHTIPSWYWTSSDKGTNDEFAWYVLFRNGISLSDLKERPKHIRLVRNNAEAG